MRKVFIPCKVFDKYYHFVYIVDMNNKQRENVSKLMYDLVRFSFVGFIVGGIVTKEHVNTGHIILGLTVSVVAFSIGYFFDKGDG